MHIGFEMCWILRERTWFAIVLMLVIHGSIGIANSNELEDDHSLTTQSVVLYTGWDRLYAQGPVCVPRLTRSNWMRYSRNAPPLLNKLLHDPDGRVVAGKPLGTSGQCTQVHNMSQMMNGSCVCVISIVRYFTAVPVFSANNDSASRVWRHSICSDPDNYPHFTVRPRRQGRIDAHWRVSTRCNLYRGQDPQALAGARERSEPGSHAKATVNRTAAMNTAELKDLYNPGWRARLHAYISRCVSL